MILNIVPHSCTACIPSAPVHLDESLLGSAAINFNKTVCFYDVIWHSYEQRSVCAQIEFAFHKEEFIRLHWAAELKCLEYSNLKLNVTISEIKQLSNNYSPFPNSFWNVFTSDWALSIWTSGRNFCSSSDWKTAASSKAADSGLTLFT